MLSKKLQNIFDKYKKENWLSGNFIPPEEKEKYKIMFIGEKPSTYFIRKPQLRLLGNFNATSTCKALHCYLQKYGLGKIYITDMVKTEGKAGADFISEWRSRDIFKKCLEEEIKCYNPKIVVFISKDVEKLFNENFGELKIKKFRIDNPSYVYRYKKFEKWDKQFKKLIRLLKK